MDARQPNVTASKSADTTGGASPLTRVAELEAQLAIERGENGRRMKDVEAKFQSLRTTLGAMQEDFKRSAVERERMRALLAERGEEVGSLRRDLDFARAASVTVSEAPEDAAHSRSEIEALTERIRELESESISATVADPAHAARIEHLEREIRKRDHALVVGAETTSAHETRIASLETKLDRARSRVAEIRETLLSEKKAAVAGNTSPGAGAPDSAPDTSPDSAPPAPVAGNSAAPATAVANLDGFPEIPGLRSESVAESFEFGVRFHAREIETRRAVTVLLLARQLEAVDGKRLDSLLASRHHNLASAICLGDAPARQCIVFERPGGETVEQWVRRIGPLPERTVVPVALQVARGLRQAAFHGALHGDLGPRAVWVDTGGRVQVEDAGVAALFPAGDRTPRSFAFASPERLRGSPPPDARSDVYSLGAVMFFLLTGHPPFEGDRDAVVRVQNSSARLDPRCRRPDVSGDVARLVMKLTARDPDQRPLTWDEVLVDLERLMPRPAPGGEPAGSRAELVHFMAARPYLFASLAAVPLVAVAALLYFATGAVPTSRERFALASKHAGVLIGRGDVEGARAVLAPFVRDTGDGDVEREAAARLRDLSGK